LIYIFAVGFIDFEDKEEDIEFYLTSAREGTLCLRRHHLQQGKELGLGDNWYPYWEGSWYNTYSSLYCTLEELSSTLIILLSMIQICSTIVWRLAIYDK